MLKTLAKVFGWIFLLIGVLGFIPGVTNDQGLLLNIFHVNALHNIVHLLSGAVALYAASVGTKAAKTYFQVFGVVYLLVTVLGFYYGSKDILGLIANNTADNFLHVVIAVIALYAGFAVKEEAAA